MKEEEPKEEAKATDKAQAAEPEPKKEKKVKEPEVEKGPSFREQYESKLEEKSPKMAGYWSTFKSVWAETFPDPDAAVKNKMSERRERAKLQREHEEKLAEMTPEEIEEMEKNIPEWKRQALVV